MFAASGFHNLESQSRNQKTCQRAWVRLCRGAGTVWKMRKMLGRPACEGAEAQAPPREGHQCPGGLGVRMGSRRPVGGGLGPWRWGRGSKGELGVPESTQEKAVVEEAALPQPPSPPSGLCPVSL